MTKNSLCSCPQTCKLITSWVNSVKAADFQGMHVTPASTPSGCAANRWEGPRSPPGQHLMRLQFLWLSPSCLLVSVLHFSHAISFSSSPSMVAWPCVSAGWGRAVVRCCLMTIWLPCWTPCFLFKTPGIVPNKPTGLATSCPDMQVFNSPCTQLLHRAGVKKTKEMCTNMECSVVSWLSHSLCFSPITPKIRGWHLPAASSGWLHQCAVSNLGVCFQTKMCPEKERPPQCLFWGCPCTHGVHTRAHPGDKTQQLFPLCSQPRTAQVAGET